MDQYLLDSLKRSGLRIRRNNNKTALPRVAFKTVAPLQEKAIWASEHLLFPKAASVVSVLGTSSSIVTHVELTNFYLCN